MEQHKSCQADEDCFALSCGCYNNDAIILKYEYEKKGCQMPKYGCIIPTCICLENQSLVKDFELKYGIDIEYRRIKRAICRCLASMFAVKE